MICHNFAVFAIMDKNLSSLSLREIVEYAFGDVVSTTRACGCVDINASIEDIVGEAFVHLKKRGR